MSHTFSPAPGITLAYDLDGDGPGLLCLPGLGAGRDSFRDTAVAARSHRTVLRVDYRGIGGSTADGELARSFTWEDLADDHEVLIDHVAATRPGFLPLEIVGMSFGGVLTQLLAYRRPETIAHVTLVSTAHRKTPYTIRTNALIQLLIDRCRPELFGETIGTFLFTPDFIDANPGLKSLRQDAVIMAVDLNNQPEPGGAGFEQRYRPAFVRMAGLGESMPKGFEEPFPLPPSQVTAIVGAQDQIVSPQGRDSILQLAGAQIVLPSAGHVIGELAQLVANRIATA